jgi:hypothetical protein
MSDQKIPLDTDTNSATTPPADDAAEAEHSTERTERISARAHFKSQHPGSAAANPDKNWLEAEREIDSATKGDQR